MALVRRPRLAVPVLRTLRPAPAKPDVIPNPESAFARAATPAPAIANSSPDYDGESLLTDPEVEGWIRAGKGWCAKDRLRQQPRLPVIRIGRSCRYRVADVRAYLESCRQSLVAA